MESIWAAAPTLSPGEKPLFNPQCYKQLGYPHVKIIFADVTGETEDVILWCEVSSVDRLPSPTPSVLQVCWICIVINGQHQSPQTAWEKHVNDSKHRMKLDWRDRMSRKLCTCSVGLFTADLCIINHR